MPESVFDYSNSIEKSAIASRTGSSDDDHGPNFSDKTASASK